eukprot:CAMPEP_0183296442 /NCGR_PEP_ID=MMETSP0160_2-20130417/3990_1 /TAXON_ID=2839 ORGANISM="Odontella Sinensis, Strain Grunow 1884" /NCGR_SAMPLE_ID=MMETSP0160_2 /ASSEMBLY_ACC=CAM_ASM_000250 /LENGTH=127 /DNA_ID=CAMNT_0025458055 /DNA_START=247 /DNA_END=630 /DNA_ORIENTATION=+
MSLLAMTKTAPLVASHLGLGVSPVAKAVVARHLSSSGSAALEKLRRVFEDYRKENYTQEVPSRFKKELVKAADKNKNGQIPVDGIECLLRNIGASDRITRKEIEILLSEAGDLERKTIPVDQMIKLI